MDSFSIRQLPMANEADAKPQADSEHTLNTQTPTTFPAEQEVNPSLTTTPDQSSEHMRLDVDPIVI